MADRVASQESFTVVNGSIRRIALQPGVRDSGVSTMRAAGGGGNDDPRTVDAAQLPATAGYGAAPASLSPNPKNLYEVWQAGVPSWNWWKKSSKAVHRKGAQRKSEAQISPAKGLEHG
jgi:hypothetical protein